MVSSAYDLMDNSGVGSWKEIYYYLKNGINWEDTDKNRRKYGK